MAPGRPLHNFRALSSNLAITPPSPPSSRLRAKLSSLEGGTFNIARIRGRVVTGHGPRLAIHLVHPAVDNINEQPYYKE